MLERDIQDAIRLAVAKLGATLFRQNVGTGWTGEVIRGTGQVFLRAGDLVIRNARPLHAGLHIGSPDLCGWHSVIVTPEMIGKKIAVFTGIECKSKRGRVSDQQRNFLERLHGDGGIAVVARSDADAIKGILEWNTTKL